MDETGSGDKLPKSLIYMVHFYFILMVAHYSQCFLFDSGCNVYRALLTSISTADLQMRTNFPLLLPPQQEQVQLGAT